MAEYETKEVFARCLGRFLEAANETQAQLAAILGVSKSTVSSWFTGEKMPRMDKIEALAEHFGITKADLLDGDGLDPFEAELVGEVRSLSAESKQKLLELARHLARLEGNHS